MADNYDIKERLIKFVSSLKITKAEFERRAGLSNGYLRNFKGNLGREKLEGILRAFPSLSKTWLLTGEGNMLISSTGSPEILEAPAKPAEGDMALRLLALVESQQQTIAQLTESNRELALAVAGYKKASTEPAPMVGAPSVAD